MLYRVLPMLMAALALCLFLSGPVLADDTKVLEGKVVSTANGKLIMADSNGKEYTHNVPANTPISIDGRAAKLEDLQPGMKVRVTTSKDDPKTALKIEGLTK